MKILADENVHREIVNYLRVFGHDVLYVTDEEPSEQDANLVKRAWEEQRIIISRDLDFGDLIVRQKMNCHGMLLLRFHTPRDVGYIENFRSVWPRLEHRISGHMIVVTNTRIKARELE